MTEGRYRPNIDNIFVSDIFDRITALINYGNASRNRTLSFVEPETPIILEVDATLLVRVIVNMVRNALEAVPKGSTIQIKFRDSPESHRFEVTNPGEMSPEVIPRVFEKHFSTKRGNGRGIGTWGMRLFGERYLGGKVDCHITSGATTFYIALPKKPRRYD